MVPTARSTQARVASISLAALRVALQAMHREHPARAPRLRQAAQLVAWRIIEPDPAGGWWVWGGRGRDYHVVGQDCTCPALARQGDPCGHVLAVELFQRCARAAA
jgi:hypothetical protein